MNKGITYGIGLGILTLLLFASNLFWGALYIPFADVFHILCGEETAKTSWQYIIWDNRLPQALTATLCGAALAVSGLLLQTAFRNPLAGPSILGIDSGANLGVAIVMLGLGGVVSTSTFSLGGFALVIIAAMVGAMSVMGLLLFFSTLLKNDIMLLITGIMLGYITSSAISLLQYTATESGMYSFMVWGLGSFSGTTWERMPAFVATILIGLACAAALIKPLNALLLGTNYARNLGIPIRRTRTLLLWATGLLTASCTAFCGPIAFIGLAVPHLARLLLGSTNHRSLLPTTMLIGASLALLCNLISTLPGDAGLIPINVITPILGAPVIIYVILKQRW